MKNKVTIIGAGSVGATVAYTLVATGSVAEIVLIDVNEAKAQGEAMDILQATPYLSPAKVHFGTYEDAVGWLWKRCFIFYRQLRLFAEFYYYTTK